MNCATTLFAGAANCHRCGLDSPRPIFLSVGDSQRIKPDWIKILAVWAFTSIIWSMMQTWPSLGICMDVAALIAAVVVTRFTQHFSDVGGWVQVILDTSMVLFATLCDQGAPSC